MKPTIDKRYLEEKFHEYYFVITWALMKNGTILPVIREERPFGTWDPPTYTAIVFDENGKYKKTWFGDQSAIIVTNDLEQLLNTEIAG